MKKRVRESSGWNEGRAFSSDLCGRQSMPDRDLLRVIDANANRAREAMRVIEDYARFVLDDGKVAAELKHLRHDLAAALRPIAGEAILHRDTPADVGKSTKTDSERTRESAGDVIIAAGKRLGEALRAIEEFAKAIDPSLASSIESLRYRFYDIEHRLAFTLRPTVSRFAEVKLYVLITESLCKGPWLDTAEQAILGGTDCLQLREKQLESRELLERARQLVELCHRHGALCIINDRPDIAILAKADGVHVGQQDLPPREVRKLIGVERIVGVSTHSIDQAKQAVLDGADYIGVGPMYRSATKPRDFLPGIEYARQVAAANLPIPAVAIAGIDAANVDEVMASGIGAVAVTAAVIGTADPRESARRIKCKLLQHSETGCPKR
jgi:thiamine-phosphate pyrophosphorylase